ncbi:MAG: hypothetical protein ABR507_05500 [Actinomycetota bacterium]
MSHDKATNKVQFDEIDVKRINVIGPDGGLRMVITNEDRLPDPVVDGQTLKRQGSPKWPAIIFYNQRGDECGGLLFYGGEETDESPTAGAALLFDQYRSDQILGLSYGESKGERSYGLTIWQRGNRPLSEFNERRAKIDRMEDPAERSNAFESLWEDFPVAQRLFVGKNDEGEAIVALADTKGKPRIRMLVGNDDTPRIEFLDSEGAVTYSLPPGT